MNPAQGIDLPNAAQPAWLAYCAMLRSKEAHFAFLEALDKKYAEGGRRTLAEIAHLDSLLTEHDRCVADFGATMRALAKTDANAHTRLVAALGELNRSLGESDPGPAH